MGFLDDPQDFAVRDLKYNAKYRRLTIVYGPYLMEKTLNYDDIVTDYLLDGMAVGSAAGFDVRGKGYASLASSYSSTLDRVILSVFSPSLPGSPIHWNIAAATLVGTGRDVTAMGRGFASLSGSYNSTLDRIVYSTFVPSTVGVIQRTATFVVAASNATQAVKDTAGPYVCDGTADEVQIQAAIDALPSGGGEVVLSVGTFTVAAGITIPDNTTLRGAGIGITIIYLADSTDTDNLLIVSNEDTSNGNTNIHLRDFTVDGNRDGQSLTVTNQVGVKLYKCTAFSVDRVESKNVGASDLLSTTTPLAEGFSFTGNAQNDSEGTVTDCIARYNGHYGFNIYQTSEIVIKGCLAASNNRHGFGAAMPTRCQWIGNRSLENRNQGFWTRNTLGCIISDNVIRTPSTGTGIYGIQLKRETADPLPVMQQNTIVSNNVIMGQGNPSAIGIYIQNHVHYATVEGNQVSSLNMGIYLINVSHSVITNNQLEDGVTTAITWSGGANYNNIIRGNLGYNVEEKGIAPFYAGSLVCTIAHNAGLTPSLLQLNPQTNPSGITAYATNVANWTATYVQAALSTTINATLFYNYLAKR
uniref:Putative pectate lyase n=1 Tax=viral metagenome TaxID=1070528 RepID=A0A6M3XB04_9ZZZZ